VQRHVAPRAAVPLHPEAVAFAGHYGFEVDVLAAYRPMGKGRVERQVDIVRAHVLAGRAFWSLQEMDQAFADWAPLRRAQVHRTHGEVIGVRAAADHAALRPLPATRYLVAEQHLRRNRPPTRSPWSRVLRAFSLIPASWQPAPAPGSMAGQD
jgi:hypothetical protein